MSSQRHVLILTALLSGVLVGRIVASAPAPTAASVAASVSEDLSLSACLAEKRDIKTLYDHALARLQHHQVREALQLFQQILDEPADAFVDDATTQINVRQAVYRHLADPRGQAHFSAPTSTTDCANTRRNMSQTPTCECLRRMYEHDFGAVAHRLLESATARGGIDEWREVVTRYRYTSSGGKALKRLADHDFDHGRFRLAAAAYRELIAHPYFGRSNSRSLFARQVIAQARAGAIERARLDFKRHYAQLDPANGTSDGVDWTCDWLAQQIDRAAQTQSRDAVFERRFPSRESDRRHAQLTFGLTPTWQLETPQPVEVASLIDAIQNELADQGLSPITSMQPMTIGQVVVVRTLDGLTVLDAVSGRLLWQRQCESLWHKDPKRLLNSAWRQRVTEELEQRIYAETLLGRLSSDGTRLFAIGRPVLSNRGRSELREPRIWTAQDGLKSTNQLEAYDLRTGERLWQIDTVHFGFNEVAGKPFFLGPPCLINQRLYQLVQCGDEIRLLALRAEDGRLTWSLHLATAPIGLSRDPLRSVTACRVVFQDGVLICPTSAGIVLAVDCLTHRILWAYRYGRDDVPRAHRTRPVEGDSPAQFRWWETWRETKVLVDTENVVLASRESRDLHVLDLKTGRIRWKQPRMRGADLASLVNSTILLIESSQAVTLDAATGKKRWSVPLPAASGYGVWLGKDFVLPLSSGSFAVIDLVQKTVRTSRSIDPSALGNLASSFYGLISQTCASVSLFPVSSVAVDPD